MQLAASGPKYILNSYMDPLGGSLRRLGDQGLGLVDIGVRVHGSTV